jgi:hypothetical protein
MAENESLTSTPQHTSPLHSPQQRCISTYPTVVAKPITYVGKLFTKEKCIKKNEK